MASEAFRTGVSDPAEVGFVPDTPSVAPSVRLTESTRVETFSDGVMAIVITLLVLELRVPAHDPGHLLEALAGTWGALLAFVISFVRVSVIWLNHHALFVRVRMVDRTVLLLNLGLLLNCTIIPLPTAVLADALQSGNPSDLRGAAVSYALLAALQSAVWIPIFRHLRDHPELVEPGTDAALFGAQTLRGWVGAGIDVAAALVALVSPAAMLVLWTISLGFLAATSDGIERVWMKKSAVRKPPNESESAARRPA